METAKQNLVTINELTARAKFGDKIDDLSNLDYSNRTFEII